LSCAAAIRRHCCLDFGCDVGDMQACSKARGRLDCEGPEASYGLLAGLHRIACG
jgi:hypothetical protein